MAFLPISRGVRCACYCNEAGSTHSFVPSSERARCSPPASCMVSSQLSSFLPWACWHPTLPQVTQDQQHAPSATRPRQLRGTVPNMREPCSLQRLLLSSAILQTHGP